MEIRILGSGCPTCKKLFELTKEVVDELKLDSQVKYVTDIEEIVKMGVMSSPVLAIDDKAVISGRLPEKEEIVKEIQKHSK